jgi:hypothetical protein
MINPQCQAKTKDGNRCRGVATAVEMRREGPYFWCSRHADSRSAYLVEAIDITQIDPAWLPKLLTATIRYATHLEQQVIRLRAEAAEAATLHQQVAARTRLYRTLITGAQPTRRTA